MKIYGYLILFAWLSLTAPLTAQTVEGLGFSFRYDPTVFRSVDAVSAKRWTDADNGEDLPDPAAPAHSAFTLHQVLPAFVRASERDFTDAHLNIIPLKDGSVPDFSKAYSDLVGNAEDLQKLLSVGLHHPALNSNLPEWALIDAAQSLHAKVQKVEGAWCVGIQYLTQEVQDASSITNESLMYVFQGISRDGTYYISLKAPVAHPMLKPYGSDDGGDTEAKNEAYLNQMEGKLTHAPDGSFAPSLEALRALVLSIRPRPETANR